MGGHVIGVLESRDSIERDSIAYSANMALSSSPNYTLHIKVATHSKSQTAIWDIACNLSQ